MYRIRRFSVLKTATVVAVMYFLLFLIGTLLVALLVAVAGSSARDVGGANFTAAGVTGVLIGGLILSLVYTVVGWVFTAIACLIYNLAAAWVGGIEVQVEPVNPPPPPPVWGVAATPGLPVNTPASTPGMPPTPAQDARDDVPWSAPSPTTDTARYDPNEGRRQD